MKRLIALLMLLVVLFSLTACVAAPSETTGNTEPTQSEPTEPEDLGYIVPEPMQRPMYTFEGTPTNEQLRMAAVQAMRDMLSIQWYTTKELTYQKTGSVSDKVYIFSPDKIYAGLPYTNGQSNIYVWFEYYDSRNGRLNFNGTGSMFNTLLGNTCTGSLMWAWSAVCDSLTGSFVNYLMVYKNGCIPVGSYTYDFTISSYKEYSTEKICEDNGIDVMFESYAQLLPADAVTSSPHDHGMMVIEPAHVEYTADGKIDGENSYIIVQDQRAGGDSHAVETEEGYTLNYSGRLSAKCTFDWLYEKSYIPCTTAEFAGKDPYAAQNIRFSNGACNSTDDLLNGAILSNYPMSMMKISAVDENGEKTTIQSTYFKREDVGTGLARNYDFTAVKQILKPSLNKVKAGSTIYVEITASNGEVFTPVSYKVQ